MVASGVSSTQGQRGTSLEMGFGDFNANEKAVLEALSRSEAMTIKEIVVANGWQADGSKGNSRVRNSLRRPVRSGWAEHTKRMGDGKYCLTTIALGHFGEAAKIAARTAGPMPFELSREEARVISHDVEAAAQAKKAECCFYNDCLQQAVSGNWPGFSCGKCNAYVEPDPHQKMMNLVRLRALDMAAELLEETGSPCRVRGVKPGADAKRTVRTPEPPTETVSLFEALEDD